MTVETLQFCNLSDPMGAIQTASAIANKYAVVHYGATYGIAFDPDHRLAVAKARKEDLTNLATVSLVASYADMITWIDTSKLPPKLKSAVEDDSLQILEQVSFIRFPVKETAKLEFSQFCINELGEIQVFPVPVTDPIIMALKNKFGKNHYAVRSSNLHGDPERTTYFEAEKLAIQIGALAIAVINIGTQKNEKFRTRTASQPILSLTSVGNEAALLLTRSGNTHPDTLRDLVSPILDHGVAFIHREENPPKFSRPQYMSSLKKPHRIKTEILRASGLS